MGMCCCTCLGCPLGCCGGGAASIVGSCTRKADIDKSPKWIGVGSICTIFGLVLYFILCDMCVKSANARNYLDYEICNSTGGKSFRPKNGCWQRNQTDPSIPLNKYDINDRMYTDPSTCTLAAQNLRERRLSTRNSRQLLVARVDPHSCNAEFEKTCQRCEKANYTLFVSEHGNYYDMTSCLVYISCDQFYQAPRTTQWSLDPYAYSGGPCWSTMGAAAVGEGFFSGIFLGFGVAMLIGSACHSLRKRNRQEPTQTVWVQQGQALPHDQQQMQMVTFHAPVQAVIVAPTAGGRNQPAAYMMNQSGGTMAVAQPVAIDAKEGAPQS